MNNSIVNKNRRRVIKTTFLGAAVFPLSQLIALKPSYAQEKLDENSALATSLNYKHDASTVTDPKRSADQFCHNCQLYQAKEAEEWASCPIFQNQLVAGNGWCSAWVQKAG